MKLENNCSNCKSSKEDILDEYYFIFSKGNGYDYFSLLPEKYEFSSEILISKENRFRFYGSGIKGFTKDLVLKSILDKKYSWLCYKCAGFECRRCGKLATVSDSLLINNSLNPTYIPRKYFYRACTNIECVASKVTMEHFF